MTATEEKKVRRKSPGKFVCMRLNPGEWALLEEMFRKAGLKTGEKSGWMKEKLGLK